MKKLQLLHQKVTLLKKIKHNIANVMLFIVFQNH
jgi:hypothetical protein